jgi:hypothetical protein
MKQTSDFFLPVVLVLQSVAAVVPISLPSFKDQLKANGIATQASGESDAFRVAPGLVLAPTGQQEALWRQLVDWVEASGGDHRVELVYNAGVRGIGCALDVCAAGEPLVSIPEELFFSATNLQNSRASNAAHRAAFERLGAALPLQGKFQLTLLLMYERYHLHDSFWAPYLLALPAIDLHPIYWPSDELKFIRGQAHKSQLPKVVNEVIDITDRIYKIMEGTVFKMDGTKGFFPALQEHRWELYKWATAMVSTRSTNVGGEPVMIPVHDMINHDDEGPSPTISINSANRNEKNPQESENSKESDVGGGGGTGGGRTGNGRGGNVIRGGNMIRGGSVIRASREYKRGEEVHISYVDTGDEKPHHCHEHNLVSTTVITPVLTAPILYNCTQDLMAVVVAG